jgi:predicted AAA+ superfamily ATPase
LFPQLFRYVKVVIDRACHRMGQFLLTSSQQFVLMNKVADSLAGRTAIASLQTLSLAELGEQAPKDWNASLARGLFPELWCAPEISSAEFHAAYLATYLGRGGGGFMGHRA